MKNEFVPYDIALAMKELGFDEPCIACFNGLKTLYGFNHIENFHTVSNSSNFNEEVSTPLYQQAFRWFREEQGLWYSVKATRHKIDKEESIRFVFDIFTRLYKRSFVDKSFRLTYTTYEEAQDACLRKLIEIVNEKK